MASTTKNGYTVLKLRETHAEEKHRRSEAATMFRLWSLLSNDAAMRDLAVGPRNIV